MLTPRSPAPPLPCAARGDQVTIATTMTLTLSIDHRAVDGATAARFLIDLRELIEQPLDIVL
jgi:pyruvate dehydrogenase E2 component (dihydrolipoamide acetyltransferase)